MVYINDNEVLIRLENLNVVLQVVYERMSTNVVAVLNSASLGIIRLGHRGIRVSQHSGIGAFGIAAQQCESRNLNAN